MVAIQEMDMGNLVEEAYLVNREVLSSWAVLVVASYQDVLVAASFLAVLVEQQS